MKFINFISKTIFAIIALSMLSQNVLSITKENSGDKLLEPPVERKVRS